MSSQSSVLSIRNTYRSTHHFYDYDGDGRFPKDRIKGSNKKHECRWKKRFIHKLVMKESE